MELLVEMQRPSLSSVPILITQTDFAQRWAAIIRSQRTKPAGTGMDVGDLSRIGRHLRKVA